MNSATARVVHIPLQKSDKCCVCNSTTSLRICSSCGERMYCSTECQKSEWGEHKKICGRGKTQRLDLYSFWPFLAYLAEINRMHEDRLPHPAIGHPIANNPIPNNQAYPLPDGTNGNLVILGNMTEEEPVNMTQFQGRVERYKRWWPSGLTGAIRRKLLFRIVREGDVLPICISICFALLAEIYTTTYDPDLDPDRLNQRIRLSCEGSPIADFGICKGSVDVDPKDTLSYCMPTEDGGITFFHGQDPKDHYWIYFTTLKGERFWMDLCLFTFNFCMLIWEPNSYMPLRPNYPQPTLSGYFSSKAMRQLDKPPHHELKRFSVMHNKALQEIVPKDDSEGRNWGDAEKKVLIGFLEHVAGKNKTDADKLEKESEMVVKYTLSDMFYVRDNLRCGDYLNYPKNPEFGFVTYDGEEEPQDGRTRRILVEKVFS